MSELFVLCPFWFDIFSGLIPSVGTCSSSPRNVYDFTKYVSEHPTSSTSDTSITGFANSGILAYPANHPMSYLEALKNVRISARKGAKPLLQPVARYGDMMIVDDFAKLVGINKDPVALKAVADLGEIRLNNVINKNRNGGT